MASRIPPSIGEGLNAATVNTAPKIGPVHTPATPETMPSTYVVKTLCFFGPLLELLRRKRREISNPDPSTAAIPMATITQPAPVIRTQQIGRAHVRTPIT